MQINFKCKKSVGKSKIAQKSPKLVLSFSVGKVQKKCVKSPHLICTFLHLLTVDVAH